MATIDYDEFKRKAKETAGVIADKSKEIARFVADKTVILGKVAKLSAEIATEKENVKKAYIELGKYYYEHNEEENPDTVEYVKSIDKSLENIEVKRVSIDELKAALKDCDGYDATAEEAEYETAEETSDAEPEAESQANDSEKESKEPVQNEEGEASKD